MMQQAAVALLGVVSLISLGCGGAGGAGGSGAPTAATLPVNPNCGPGPSHTGTMTALINGSPWRAACVFGRFTTDGGFQLVGHDRTPAERAVNPNSDTMVSLLIGSTSPGTYGAAPSGATVVCYVSLGSGASSEVNWVWTFGPAGRSGTGSVTFTTLSAEGSTGTFSFTTGASNPNGLGTPPRVVTNGSFSVSF